MKKKGFTLVELLVVIAIIALLMGILMPALARVRQIAFRMVCGTNLSGIGKAMLIYANDYHDEMPRAGGRQSVWGPAVVWDAQNAVAAYQIQSSGTGGHATFTASFYLLVKYAEVTPKSFICKGDSSVQEFQPGNNVDLVQLWDFGPNAKSCCSYSYNQPYGSYALTTSSDPGMAVAADPNPWCGVRDSAAFSSFTPGGGKAAQNLGNAITHQDEGQNVLFLDTHVNFENVSYCGINEDNIYTQATATEIRKGAYPASCSVSQLSRVDNLLLMDFGSSTGKGRSCFVGDTQVSVNGEMVAISQVEAGQVLGNNSVVEKLDSHTGSFECHDIELTNGNKISVAGNHLFMLDSGIWVKSVDLRSGMTLRTQSGNAVVKTVTTREQPYVGTVYNIKVQNSEQYMVGADSLVVRDW